MSDITEETSVVSDERPLVTFALFAYNQEDYIREAVEGALAQTYSPLEIIISDDCSPDHTFQIIEEMVDGYLGSHTVRINRNKKNLGISPHVRYISELSTGEIVIIAAGDDISVPERTNRMVESFSDSDVIPSMVISNGEKIDENGNPLGVIFPDMLDTVIDKPEHPRAALLPFSGCTVAINREVINAFPAPNSAVMAEDVMLMRRAYLLRGIIYIPDLLVKYRIHSGAVTSQKSNSRNEYLKYNILWTKDRIANAEQFMVDLKHVNHSHCQSLSKKLLNEIYSEKTMLDVLQGGFFSSWFSLLKGLVSSHESIYQRFRKDLIKHIIVRWIPILLGYK